MQIKTEHLTITRFTQIYYGLGNYQGKEEQIIKTIWKN